MVPQRRARRGADEGSAGTWSAGAALALVYALLKRRRPAAGKHQSTGAEKPVTRGGEGAGRMMKKPTIKSLENVSLDEATAYLEYFAGDELDAAYALAWDRNRLDGSHAAPDDAEVHHAAFLLCRTRGKCPPSFDEMRVQLRRRAAA
ncbi:MAG: hypothetical protein M3O50_05950 [Myxococcota bacterium]|nr:hypothetical protein [Myxococcota bacterium]